MRFGLAIIMLTAALAGCSADIREGDATLGKIIDDFDGEPVVPRGANRLYIAPPDNATDTPGLSSRVLDLVRKHISLDGRLGVDTNEAAADLRLDIRITRLNMQPVSYDGIGRIVRKRQWMTADVRLVNVRRRKQIFYEADLQAFRIYSDQAMPIETDLQARERVQEELAKRIAAKTVTGWYTDLMSIMERGR